MSQEMIALLELVIVGGIGLLLTIAGIWICFAEKKRVKRCTHCVQGEVIEYHFNGNGSFFPVVRYVVDGTTYRVKRRFRGVITVEKSGLKKVYIDRGAYVDEKDVLHVPMGAVTNMRSMAESLWPIGSPMSVYYDPLKPKTAYAEKCPRRMSLVSVLFIVLGLLIVALGILFYFVIRANA